MKHKVISKTLDVKNKSFIEAIASSFGKRNKIHTEVLNKAKKSGVLSKLSPSK